MDVLGGIFLFFLLLIIVITNFIFFRKINRNNICHYKYKIFFFLISIASICVIMILAALFQNVVLIDYFKITTDIESYPYRITLMTIIWIINIIANFSLLKLYIKRRERKNKNKTNDIELIGIE
ncbi:hypothetical protein C8C83_3206 [Flavobacterium sp. 90]|uniref:hypothetical protein n=1 Tax=unclassified Flavobacterium TaxID=196869 RepID=UPI000EB3469C|nr:MULTISPECIES: hypothetical protein [unclassified Flavobacterium]RKR11472.1 hypothetical protein C8C82_3516 [Flavobacterium sp. 81]TCK55254.1 hypothetical protein C8C83_3206 [Flavobacterium sp. 90]